MPMRTVTGAAAGAAGAVVAATAAVVGAGVAGAAAAGAAAAGLLAAAVGAALGTAAGAQPTASIRIARAEHHACHRILLPPSALPRVAHRNGSACLATPRQCYSQRVRHRLLR